MLNFIVIFVVLDDEKKNPFVIYEGSAGYCVTELPKGQAAQSVLPMQVLGIETKQIIDIVRKISVQCLLTNT